MASPLREPVKCEICEKNDTVDPIRVCGECWDKHKGEGTLEKQFDNIFRELHRLGKLPDEDYDKEIELSRRALVDDMPSGDGG
jgi:hypothetical protein